MIHNHEIFGWLTGSLLQGYPEYFRFLCRKNLLNINCYTIFCAPNFFTSIEADWAMSESHCRPCSLYYMMPELYVLQKFFCRKICSEIVHFFVLICYEYARFILENIIMIWESSVPAGDSMSLLVLEKLSYCNMLASWITVWAITCIKSRKLAPLESPFICVQIPDENNLAIMGYCTLSFRLSMHFIYWGHHRNFIVTTFENFKYKCMVQLTIAFRVLYRANVFTRQKTLYPKDL